MEPIPALQRYLGDHSNPQPGLAKVEQLERLASSTASAPLYLFDRTLKGDRLLVNVSKHTTRDAPRSQSAQAAREMPINPAREPIIDCDPAFSWCQ